MKKITVHVRNNDLTYPIFIGTGILRKIESLVSLEKYGKIVVITDHVIEKAFLKDKPELFSRETHTIILPVGERAKNIETVEEIWRELLALHCDRSSLIINIGGGVISDVGGFAASTFMRGLDFINVPTTLLSQVDASVGGKTGINFEDIKNIIGTFQQPKAVIIDVETLTSLPTRIFREGFGEIIKHGLVADKAYFGKVTTKIPEEFSKEELITIITRSCEIKAAIVEQDITESGVRRLVNFGHTIGHAIEAASHDTDHLLLHGEAVSIGMVAESYISLLKNMITDAEFESIVHKLEFSGLPTKILGLKKEIIMNKIHHDKKQEKGEIQWTLLQTIGKGIINQRVSADVIEQAIEKVIGV